MHELWSSASYEPHLLSLPFAFAPAAMSLVIAYAIVMRGEPLLRACLLVHFAALLPYSIVMALSPSVTSPAAAEAMFRLAAAFIPMAAAAGAWFHFVLLAPPRARPRDRRRRDRARVDRRRCGDRCGGRGRVSLAGWPVVRERRAVRVARAGLDDRCRLARLHLDGARAPCATSRASNAASCA